MPAGSSPSALARPYRGPALVPAPERWGPPAAETRRSGGAQLRWTAETLLTPDTEAPTCPPHRGNVLRGAWALSPTCPPAPRAPCLPSPPCLLSSPHPAPLVKPTICPRPLVLPCLGQAHPRLWAAQTGTPGGPAEPVGSCYPAPMGAHPTGRGGCPPRSWPRSPRGPQPRPHHLCALSPGPPGGGLGAISLETAATPDG